MEPGHLVRRDKELLAPADGAHLANAAPPPEGDAAHAEVVGGLGHRKLGGRVGGGAALARHGGEDGVALDQFLLSSEKRYVPVGIAK